MRLREFAIEDFDDVNDLWHRTKGMGLNNIDDSREGIAKFLERNPHTCFVAEDEGEGGVCGVILCGNDGRRGYIYHACVDEARRHTGIGRRLAGAVIEALAREGITKTALVAYVDNESGNAFWEHLGFHVRDDLVYRDKEIARLEYTRT